MRLEFEDKTTTTVVRTAILMVEDGPTLKRGGREIRVDKLWMVKRNDEPWERPHIIGTRLKQDGTPWGRNPREELYFYRHELTPPEVQQLIDTLKAAVEDT